MPEWLIERGIGETRYALVEDGDIVEARVELDDLVRAGSIVVAKLVKAAPRSAVVRDRDGKEYLLPSGVRGVTEGAELNIEVTREAIPGTEPWKRPLARVTDELAGATRSLEGKESHLPAAAWDDLVEEARSGIVRFAGGELRLSVTPAMTLIDVDGALAPDELAVRGAAEAAKAVRRLDIGGSIGIDLPTTSRKAARQEAAAAIDSNLPQPFERTAVNGFGFVQIVRPRRRASLLELAQDRAAFEARALLRRAAVGPPGAKMLVAHPAVIAVLDAHPHWRDALARQIGGPAGLRADPSLPMSGGYAAPN